LEGDIAIGAAFSERVLVFLGAEEPKVPAVFELEVDWLLGFLAAQITAWSFQRADERFLHDDLKEHSPITLGRLALSAAQTSRPKMIREQRGCVKNRPPYHLSHKASIAGRLFMLKRDEHFQKAGNRGRSAATSKGSRTRGCGRN
jgi:hypothetical protein